MIIEQMEYLDRTFSVRDATEGETFEFFLWLMDNLSKVDYKIQPINAHQILINFPDENYAAAFKLRWL